MSSPKDYLGGFSFWQATALGVTVFHAKGHPINTMRSTGIGFCFQVSKKRWSLSIGKKLFGFVSGYFCYKPLPINHNAQNLYVTVNKNAK